MHLMESPENDAEPRTIRHGTASMGRSASMPLLNADSIFSQRQRALHELIWMESQGQPAQYVHPMEVKSGSQTRPFANFLQESIADGPYGIPQTQLCNFISHGPPSSNDKLSLSNSEFSSASRVHETVASVDFFNNVTCPAQRFEANHPFSQAGSVAERKISRPTSVQCPPGFGSVANVVDRSSTPVYGSSMKKSSSLNALENFVSSLTRTNDHPSLIDVNEVPSITQDTVLSGARPWHSMPRSKSVGCFGAEQFSSKGIASNRVSSNATSAGQASTMFPCPSNDILSGGFTERNENSGRLSFVETSDIGRAGNGSGCQLPTSGTSPSNGIFKDVAMLNRSLSDGNCDRSSFMRHPESTLFPQQHEQLRTIPEVSSDDEALGGQESMVVRSPTFKDSSNLVESPINKNFRGFSVGNTLFTQQREQMRSIPEGVSDGAEQQPNVVEPQKLNAFDHKPFALRTSLTIAKKCAVESGCAQEWGLPQVGSVELQDTTYLLALARQKRLELQELEDALLSQLVESKLQSPSFPGVSSPLPTKTHQQITSGTVCRFYNSGKCNKGDSCSFLHLKRNATAGALGAHKSSASRTQNPRMLNMVVDGMKSGCTDGNLLCSGLDTGTMLMNNHHIPVVENSCTSPSEIAATSSHQILNYRQGLLKNLDDLEGHMCMAAKDPQLCRILQAKLVQGNPKDVEKLFEEIMKANVVELAMDPYANYLVQKLVEVSSSAQYNSMFQQFLQTDSLVTMSLNAHGTRVVQKIIVRVADTPNQRRLMISSLHRDTMRLSKDPCGSHVVQKCLQHLRHEDCLQCLYDAIISNSEEIASDQHGCLVLQRCLEFGSRYQTKQLIDAISANAVGLSQHPFGNYVVQHIFHLNLPWASKMVIFQLKGKFAELAMQKCSSNVVEKCLKVADEEDQAGIVKELMEPSVFYMLLDHPFANYVIQSALEVTQGSLHTSLVQAILPCVPELRNSTYGKRIISCSYLLDLLPS
ncbi:hypothetical protein L7F22_021618 [Adiantum nelumboides]|nr:hypothetical protein [Adiantum nelumboides]